MSGPVRSSVFGAASRFSAVLRAGAALRSLGTLAKARPTPGTPAAALKDNSASALENEVMDEPA